MVAFLLEVIEAMGMEVLEYLTRPMEEQWGEVERLQMSWLSWVVKTSHRMRGRCRKKETWRMPNTGGVVAGAAEDMAKTGGMAAGVPLEEVPSE